MIRLICLSLVLVPAVTFGQPSIGNINGVVTHNSIVIVEGSGFGIGPTIHVWENFEGGSNGSPIPGTSPEGDADPWRSHYSITNYPATFTSSRVYSGNLAARFDYSVDRVYTDSPRLNTDWPATREIYYSFYGYRSVNPGTCALNNEGVWETGAFKWFCACHPA